ncbi:MAG: LdpA C-terminal domain-containing domain [Cyanobacteriota bacterium]|nr:LdpA C-terminal domain-containing domain [Cyanobacteriota bacterium]
MAASGADPLIPPALDRAEQALRAGRWVKVIAGASNQDLEAIEDLAGIYALAGIHCLDVAADRAVVAAARRGLAWAAARGGHRPWLMVSLSDGEDPHFRKAWFDPEVCPCDCSRPCERVCPAHAIGEPATGAPGVQAAKCYGCGRCLPICPEGLIEERSQVLGAAAVAAELAALAPDAVEVHTSLGREGAFAERVQQIVAAGVPLRRLSVSCGLEGSAPRDRRAPAQLAATLWQRFATLRRHGLPPLWQLDGRPMSGDIGTGTAHAAVRLFEQVAAMAPPGPLQLAGGTNAGTGALWLRTDRRLRLPYCAGVAFGGSARVPLQPWLQQARQRGLGLLEAPDLWPAALREARCLVQSWS